MGGLEFVLYLEKHFLFCVLVESRYNIVKEQVFKRKRVNIIYTLEKIFLSHTSFDKPIVRKFKEILESHGFEVWLDEDSILMGDSILKSIERGLLMTDYVLLFLSNKALDSPWVEKEIIAAITLEIEKRENIILPILLNDLSPPLFLRDKKYIKIDDNIDNCVNEIIAVIERNKKRLESSRIISLNSELTLTFSNLEDNTTYLKTQTLKCTRGSYYFHSDGIEVDGKVNNIEISKGKIISIDRIDGRTIIKSQFDNPLYENQELKRQLKCSLIDCFPETEEFWWIQKWHQSHNMKMIFDFPIEKKPYEINLFENEGTFERLIINDKKACKINNRIIYQFEIKTVKHATRYVVRWNW